MDVLDLKLEALARAADLWVAGDMLGTVMPSIMRRRRGLILVI